MRNWNSTRPVFQGTVSISFHSTYEELKQSIMYYPVTFELVFILPMRNWNGYETFDNFPKILSFSFYLWGIETSTLRIWTSWKQGFHSTYEELKPFHHSTPPCFINHVFILPMRNWNQYNYCMAALDISSFHSTYEELKLRKRIYW